MIWHIFVLSNVHRCMTTYDAHPGIVGCHVTLCGTTSNHRRPLYLEGKGWEQRCGAFAFHCLHLRRAEGRLTGRPDDRTLRLQRFVLGGGEYITFVLVQPLTETCVRHGSGVEVLKACRRAWVTRRGAWADGAEGDCGRAWSARCWAPMGTASPRVFVRPVARIVSHGVGVAVPVAGRRAWVGRWAGGGMRESATGLRCDVWCRLEGGAAAST